MPTPDQRLEGLCHANMEFGDRTTLSSGPAPYCVCAAFGRLLCAATADACELNLDQTMCAMRSDCCFVTLGGGLCLGASHPQCSNGSVNGPASGGPSPSPGGPSSRGPESIDAGASLVSLSFSVLFIMSLFAVLK